MRALITIALLALPIEAFAEMEVNTRISLEEITVTISGATADDVSSGRYYELLSQATRDAREAYMCDLLKRSCEKESVTENPFRAPASTSDTQ